MKRAASDSIAQLFLTMVPQDAKKHGVEHHLHGSAQHLSRRCKPIATASVPGPYGPPSERKSSVVRMILSPVIIFFLRLCILASSWPLVVRTMSGVGRSVTVGCGCESVLIPSIDLCPRAMVRKPLSERYDDKMPVLCDPHRN